MPAEKLYKYNTVINYIMKYIQDNDLTDGDKLPTEQQLSNELHVSRVSIQQGIKRLEKDGFVYRIQGSGTYVRQVADRKETSVMIPLVMNAHFNGVHGFDIIRGAQEYFFSHSCHLSPHCLKEDEAKGEAYEEMVDYLVEQGNRCIMMLLPFVHSNEFFRRHMRDGVRFVFLDTPLDDFFGCHSVCSNHALGGYLVTKHLIELEHRDIVVVGPDRAAVEKNPNFMHRVEGYRQALKENGIPYRENYIVWGSRQPEQLREQLGRMLSARPRPTAIFCLNDAMADLVIGHLQGFGLRIPQDISIAGFDNGKMIFQPVTTIQQDFYGVGRYGAEMALRLLHEPDYPVTQQILPVTLIKRTTTAKISNG